MHQMIAKEGNNWNRSFNLNVCFAFILCLFLSLNRFIFKLTELRRLSFVSMCLLGTYTCTSNPLLASNPTNQQAINVYHLNHNISNIMFFAVNWELSFIFMCSAQQMREGESVTHYKYTHKLLHTENCSCVRTFQIRDYVHAKCIRGCVFVGTESDTNYTLSCFNSQLIQIYTCWRIMHLNSFVRMWNERERAR